MVFFFLFPPPHFRIIIVLKLYFHIQLVRDSYCAAISNHISFVRKTITASGQSSERISVVYGTALTLTRQCCFLSWGVEPWNDEWQPGGMCRFVTDSYRGPCILLNWSLIYKLIAFVSYLTVVQTVIQTLFYISKQLNCADYKWFLCFFLLFSLLYLGSLLGQATFKLDIYFMHSEYGPEPLMKV